MSKIDQISNGESGSSVRTKLNNAQKFLPFTTASDPAVDVAVTTAIVDANDGTVITTTTTGFDQTIASPTDTTAGKSFIVSNDGASTNVINVNSQTIQIGDFIRFVWEGSEWISDPNRNNYLNSLSTGVIDWAGLNLDTGANFTLEAGEGNISNNLNPLAPIQTPASWTQQTLVALNIATQNGGFILIDSTGTPFQINTPPTAEQRRDNIFLGRWATADNINVTTVQAEPDIAIEQGANTLDVLRRLGFIRSGARVSANGANLSLNLSSGFLTLPGINYGTDKRDANSVAIAPATPKSFFRVTQTQAVTGLVTVIDPANFDVAGNVTAIAGSNNQATNQRVFLFPSGNMIVLYGQTVYSNLDTAIQNINSEVVVVPTDVGEEASLIGIISVTKGATDLQSDSDGVILGTSKLGETGFGSSGIPIGSQQDIYNNSTQPQITTDATRGAVQIKRGSALDTDNVSEWLNGAGAVKASIDGNGLLSLDNIGEITTDAGVTVDGVLLKDGGATLSSALDMGNSLINNVTDPVSAQDVATKIYVDNIASNIKWRQEVGFSTTENITLSGEQTIDGGLTSLSRILVKNQTDQTENGIYVSALGAWTRATDTDTGSELLSSVLRVLQGTANGTKSFVNINTTTITIGITNITFGIFDGGLFTAGTGMDLTNGVFSTLANQSHVTTVGALNAGSIASGFGSIDVGSSTITTTGTVNAGVISATGNSTFQTDLSVGGTTLGNPGTRQISIGEPSSVIGGLQLWSTTVGSHFLQFGDTVTGNGEFSGFLGYNHSTDAMTLGTAETIRITLDSAGDMTMTGGGAITTTGIISGGQFNSSSSNAGAPAFAVSSNTGVYNAGVNALGFSTNSLEVMRITSAGNVGIGTPSPNYKLDVNGSFGFTPGTSVTPVDNGDVVIEFTNNTTLTFKGKGTDGTVRSATLTLT